MNHLRSTLVLALRLFLGGLFIYAAADKILNPLAFSDSVLNYHILPRPLVNVFSLWLPWVEMLVGVLILTGIWARSCAVLLSAMMVMFLVAIGLAVFRGIDIHCGCFTQGGEAKDPVSVWTVLRDMSFLSATLLSVWLENEVPTWRLFGGRQSGDTGRNR